MIQGKDRDSFGDNDIYHCAGCQAFVDLGRSVSRPQEASVQRVKNHRF